MSSGIHITHYFYCLSNIQLVYMHFQVSLTCILVDKATAFILTGLLQLYRGLVWISFKLLTMALPFSALMPFPMFLDATIPWCFWLTAKTSRLVTRKVRRALTQTLSTWWVITLPLQHNRSPLAKGLRSPNPHIIQWFSQSCLQLELILAQISRKIVPAQILSIWLFFDVNSMQPNTQ